ncbi:MAG: hypothetical protein ACTHNQ_11435 [Microbacterium sp.]
MGSRVAAVVALTLGAIVVLGGCGALTDAADSTGSGTVAVACSAVRVTAQTAVAAAKEQLTVATDADQLASALEGLQEKVDGLGAKFDDDSRLAAALSDLSAAFGAAIDHADAITGGGAGAADALADAQKGIDDAAARIGSVCDEG